MAWKIVEDSFRTTVRDIKKFIPIMAIGFVLSGAIAACMACGFYSAWAMTLVSAIASTFFILIPCYAIIYGNKPMQCLRENLRSFFALLAIQLAGTFIAMLAFWLAFPPQGDIMSFTSAEWVYNIIMLIFSIVIEFAVIHIIKNRSGAFSAICENSENFSAHTGKNIWLYIKLILINMIFTTVLGIISSIGVAVFGLIPNDIIKAVLASLFKLIISLPYTYVYRAVELSNYYETVCKKPIPYEK